MERCARMLAALLAREVQRARTPCTAVAMSAPSWGLRCLKRLRSWGGKLGPLETWRCSQTQAATKRSALTLGLVTVVICTARVTRGRQSTRVGFFVLVAVHGSATCGAGPTWHSVGPARRRGLGRRRQSKTGNSSTTSFGQAQRPLRLVLLRKGSESAASPTTFSAVHFARKFSLLFGDWAQRVSNLRVHPPPQASLALP